MKNKIGFNLLPWSAGVSQQTFPLIDRLKKIGYDGIECLIGSDNKEEYQQLSNHCQSLALEITGVMVVDKDHNPISEDAKIRQQGLDRIKWAIDRAYDMNCKLICGPFHSAHGHFAFRPATENEFAYCVDIMKQAGDYAKQAQVVLALEAVNRFENYLCNTMDQLANLLSQVDHPNVRAMFDTHHANIEEKSMVQAIQHIAPYLAHVHISENDRGTPGKGLVRWDDVFRTLNELNYEGWYTIESFSRADADFANMINVWREYSDPWEIAEEGYTFIKKHIQP